MHLLTQVINYLNDDRKKEICLPGHIPLVITQKHFMLYKEEIKSKTLWWIFMKVYLKKDS